MAQQSQQTVTVDGHDVLVVRSSRRRRTVSADLTGGQLRLRVPMNLSRKELDRHARAFRSRLLTRSSQAARSDDDLLQRARELAAKYLDSAMDPVSVTWSSQQLKRWGSTTSATGHIRLSARLKQMPEWIVDAVLVHELAHLLESDHGPAFQALVARYPKTKEADAFLEGVTWAEQYGTGGT